MNAAAASLPGAPQRGASRLIEDCTVMGRVTGGEHTTARARLEHELGGDLTRLLFRALVPADGHRGGFLGL